MKFATQLTSFSLFLSIVDTVIVVRRVVVAILFVELWWFVGVVVTGIVIGMTRSGERPVTSRVERG